MITFEQYLDYRISLGYDEINEAEKGFFSNLWQKAKDSYSSARGNPEDDVQLKNTLEGWSDKVTPHISKAAKLANEHANKLGISVPLATSIILSGMLGGPAAIPMSVLMYYVNKPVGKMASKAFDKGVAAVQNLTGQNKQNQARPMQQASQPNTPTNVMAANKPKTPVAAAAKPSTTDDEYFKSYSSPDRFSDHFESDYECASFYLEQYSRKFDFQSYAAIRDLQEGVYGDYTRKAGEYVGSKIKDFGNWLGGKVDKGHEYAKQAKNWWDEKGSDQVSGAIGKGLGFVAGKSVKYAGNISHLITSSFSSMAKWATQNKLPIAKTLFLMAVGAATGIAVGAAVNFIAAKALALSKAVKPEEVNDWLKDNYKMEIAKDKETGDYVIQGGDQLYNKTGQLTPAHQGPTDSDTYISSYTFGHDQTTQLINNKANAVSDTLQRNDTFTNVIFQKTDIQGMPDENLLLSFNATITPQTGETAKDVLNRAYQTLKDTLTEKGLMADIEQFKSITTNIKPNQPIDIAAIIKPDANLIGGAVGGAIGAKTGSKK